MYRTLAKAFLLVAILFWAIILRTIVILLSSIPSKGINELKPGIVGSKDFYYFNKRKICGPIVIARSSIGVTSRLKNKELYLFFFGSYVTLNQIATCLKLLG